MKTAALQLDIVWEDRSANYETIRGYAQKARDAGAELLILPEMFATGFSFNTSYTAESKEGETASFIRSLAQEYKMTVVGGYVQLQPGGPPHNVALACDKEGNDLGCYSKIHVFSYSGEDKVHGKGYEPVFFDVAGVSTTCFICYDLRFPELFRKVVDNVHLIVVIASWPAQRQAHWDILLKARAVENQCYIIGVNRVGKGGGLDYTGGSVIIDPLGSIISNSGGREALIHADVNPSYVNEIRTSFPFLEDRCL